MGYRDRPLTAFPNISNIFQDQTGRTLCYSLKDSILEITVISNNVVNVS